MSVDRLRHEVAELHALIEASDAEIDRLRKYRRWYVAGELRVRRALRDRGGEHDTVRQDS